MKIDTLIAVLQRVRDAKGNVDVQASGFVGTNQAHVCFDIKPPGRANFNVDNHMNDFGEFCLSVEISNYTRKEIEKGVLEMKNLGQTFYCSQFVGAGEAPRAGLSVCDWHNPW